MSQPVTLDLQAGDSVQVDLTAPDSIDLDLIGLDVTIDAPDVPPIGLDLLDAPGGVGLDLVGGDMVTVDFIEETVRLSLTNFNIGLDLGDTQAIELEFGGEQGPPGPPGPEGPAGPAGATITYSQGTASDTWTIPHALGYQPNVTTVDSAGTQLFGDLVYLDATTVQITFTWPTAGYAYLS